MKDYLFSSWILFSILTINLVSSQMKVYKLCVTSKYRDQCEQLERGNSEVACVQIQDSIECAKRLLNGTADFGFFSAESALHLASLNWEGLTVIKQMRNREKRSSTTDFESVVIVKRSHIGGLENLRGKNYCHPGLHYGKSHKWSERFLKYFESKIIPNPVTQVDCAKSAAELEASNLASTFKKACRPGKWSHDLIEDANLKKKYPALCELCDNKNQCEYGKTQGLFTSSGPNNHHQQALNCLRREGDVAYVSLEDAMHFFNELGQEVANDYSFLCENGTLQNIQVPNNVSSQYPCVWLRQPWGVLITNSENAVILGNVIDGWLENRANDKWKSLLGEILEYDIYITQPTVRELPVGYIRQFRPIPQPEIYCGSDISWCTTSREEKEKCEIIRAGGITTGVRPQITCHNQLEDTVHCLSQISENISDFMGIDSNYGYLARRSYNLTAAMYFETEREQYSSIVVVVRRDTKFKSFNDLKGSKACLPEFGATPSIAFINLGKERKFFKRNECEYAKLLQNFFGPSCAPGANDLYYDRHRTSSPSLCTLCEEINIRNGNVGLGVNITAGSNVYAPPSRISCDAGKLNRYYGNEGALRCLYEAGDVAILELQTLKDHAKSLGVDEHGFRIICRNGSLAGRSGFDVDPNCPLTVVVDGEVVVHRKSTKVPNIVNALTALDTYFQYDPDFKMYNVFEGEKHLLFKDSTIGLISAQEQNVGNSVKNYIKLFKNLEDCVEGSAAAKTGFTLLSLILISFTASFLLN